MKKKNVTCPMLFLLIRTKQGIRELLDFQLDFEDLDNVTNGSVTFDTAAVRSKISTANYKNRAAVEFLRSHALAVTFATAAARRIFNLWRQKICGCRTAFKVMTHGRLRASLRLP